MPDTRGRGPDAKHQSERLCRMARQTAKEDASVGEPDAGKLARPVRKGLAGNTVLATARTGAPTIYLIEEVTGSRPVAPIQAYIRDSVRHSSQEPLDQMSQSTSPRET